MTRKIVNSKSILIAIWINTNVIIYTSKGSFQLFNKFSKHDLIGLVLTTFSKGFSIKQLNLFSSQIINCYNYSQILCTDFQNQRGYACRKSIFTKIITFHKNARSIPEMSNILSLAYRKTLSPTQELSNDWNKTQSCIHGTSWSLPSW